MNKYDLPIDLNDENSMSIIIKQIKPNSKVLEFGPATGRMTEYISKELNCEVYIVELDEEAYLTASKFAITGICGDIEKFEWLDKFRNIKFDYITFGDVLEHLINPREVLIKSKELLAYGGRLITSIPNIAHNSVIVDLLNNKFSYSETGILDNTHLRFFTYYTLQQMFDDSGLTIINEQMVYKNLEQADFYSDFQDVPSEYVNLLGKRDFAYAYQFIFTSVDKNYYVHNCEEIVINKCTKINVNETPIIQSVFIDDGSGYNENNKLVQNSALDHHKFNFNLQICNENQIYGLRFDPCEYASKVKINSVTSNLSDLKIVAQNASYHDDGFDVFIHSDPIYYLTSEEIHNIKFLSINGEIININPVVLQQYNKQYIQDSQNEIIEKMNEINHHKDDLKRLNDEFEQNKNVYNQLKSDLTNYQTMVEKLNQDKTEMQSVIGKNKDEIIVLNSVITNNQETIGQLTKTITENKENIRQLTVDVYTLNVMNNKKTSEIDGLNSALDNVTAKLNELYNSSSWRYTKPFRYILMMAKKIKARLETKIVSRADKKIILTNQKSIRIPYDITVSIVIPTYNGGGYLRPLFEMFKKQKGIRNIEIVIIDSGSKDDTVSICKEYCVNLIQITQSEFSHSYARNLGASKANGTYLLFMTQDALPSNEYWVYNMMTPIMKHNIVAVSCVEQPREDCELAYRVESENFATYLGVTDSDRIGVLPAIQNYETLRKNGQLNDVSCAIVKEVFDKFKYEGDYAEDLAMGVRLIKEGYKIAFLSSEKVIHSHNRSCGYYMKRATVDGKTLRKMFLDFPFMEQQIDNIIGATLYAYHKLSFLFEHIDQIDVDLSPKDFFDDIEKYWINLFLIRSVNIESLQFGKPYSDIVADSYLKRMAELYNRETVDQEYMQGHIIHYTNNTLIPYVKKYYTVVDSKLRDQIIDTIYKRLLSTCGNDLSIYVILHPQDSIFKELVEELQKGV